MTPSQKQQIKQALERYYVEHEPAWSAYYLHIKTTLKMKDNDKLLHERDPRNWLKEGKEPTIRKLNLYEKFIRKIYPDFEFLPEEVSDDIELGLAFARFSNTQVLALGSEARKEAAFYDRKIYVEEKLWDDELPHGHLITLVRLKHIAGTPFLKVLQLDLFSSGGGNDIISQMIDLFFGNEMTANEEAANLMNEHFWDLYKSGSIHFANYQTGIVLPGNMPKAYHGLIKTADAFPYHILLEEGRSRKGFSVKKIGRDHPYSRSENWLMCNKTDNLGNMFYLFERQYLNRLRSNA